MSGSEKYTQDALDKYTWSYFRNTALGEQLWVFVTESTAPFQILENQKRSVEFSSLLLSLSALHYLEEEEEEELHTF